MSFLKIDDQSKRDFMFEEFQKSKKNIQENYLSEKLGDIGLQRELTKLYKPITDIRKALQEDVGIIKENLSSLKALPSTISSTLKSIRFPQYPSIDIYEDASEDVETSEIDEIAA